MIKSKVPGLTFLLIMAFNLTLAVSIYSLGAEIKSLKNGLPDKTIEERTTVYYPSYALKACPRAHYTKQDIDNLLPAADQGDCDALSVLYSYSIALKNQPDYDKFERYIDRYKNSQCSGTPCEATFEVEETSQTHYLYPYDHFSQKTGADDKH